MNDLFYTEHDNTLFWVSGYDVEYNNSYVTQFTSKILEQAQQFATRIGCTLGEVRSVVVNKSSRYKHRRVFYINKSESRIIPKGTYVILQWDMWKWLEY